MQQSLGANENENVNRNENRRNRARSRGRSRCYRGRSISVYRRRHRSGSAVSRRANHVSRITTAATYTGRVVEGRANDNSTCLPNAISAALKYGSCLSQEQIDNTYKVVGNYRTRATNLEHLVTNFIVDVKQHGFTVAAVRSCMCEENLSLRSEGCSFLYMRSSAPDCDDRMLTDCRAGSSFFAPSAEEQSVCKCQAPVFAVVLPPNPPPYFFALTADGPASYVHTAHSFAVCGFLYVVTSYVVNSSSLCRAEARCSSSITTSLSNRTRVTLCVTLPPCS